ncbi:hypothetical protein CTA2_6207 [Colletotrichum tanaceti]|uniref:Uncharacterized protein n=1 Tax=Colletotrichum tanaceti TaxID=1306861 RepID=A0A4U6XJS0_9PEZI|nr:hypothetical protein CTA2_6207 [Colletotrichum tanaceti]TKW55813.1 hypothetical protein CTA1_4241 [Colletotrichum tanaceti]
MSIQKAEMGSLGLEEISLETSAETAKTAETAEMKPLVLDDLPLEIREAIAKMLRTHCFYPTPHLASYKASKKTLSSLCLVSKKWNEIATPLLYETFNSTEKNTTFGFLEAIIKRPDLGAHVKTAYLTPSGSLYRKAQANRYKQSISDRAAAVGIDPVEHDRYWGSRSSHADSIWESDLRFFLEEMILLHTPNMVSVTFKDRPEVVDARFAFRFLAMAAVQNPQELEYQNPLLLEQQDPEQQQKRQWDGLKSLRNVAIEMGVSSVTDERSHAGYLCRLASFAPHVRVLKIHEVFVPYCFHGHRLASHAASLPRPPMVVPPRLAVFLANLTSLKFASHVRFAESPKVLRQMVAHCTGLVEVQYAAGSLDAASALHILYPLRPTLKRLRLTLQVAPGDRTIWDGLNSLHVSPFHIVASFAALEVLRFDFTGRCLNELPPCYANRPDMTAALMRALPPSLRVLFLTGCEWAYLVEGISQLRKLLEERALPRLQKLHVACTSLARDRPFIDTFAKLGVDMKIFLHRFASREENAGLEEEGWDQYGSLA